MEGVTDYDLSGQGTGRDMVPTQESSSDREAEDISVTDFIRAPIDQQGTNIVRNLKFESFRAKLITHFDVQYQKKTLKWPVTQGYKEI